MLSSVAKGYKKLLSGIGVTLALALCCLALGVIIVLPLWKWATGSPKTYSAVILAVLACLLVWSVIRHARKTGIAAFIRKSARILCVVAGLGLCLFLLYSGRRLVALVTVPVTLVAYGLVSFGFQKK